MVDQPAHRNQSHRSRRHVLATMVSAGSAVLVAGGPGVLAQSHSVGTSTPDVMARPEDAISRIAPPDWSFIVYAIQDPYELPDASTLVVPPDTYFVAFEVEIDNASDQPLSFATGQVRLRAAEGREYTSGVAAGPETTLKARILPPGERTRGWIWFNVPDDAELTDLVYIAQSPEFSLSLTD